MFSTSKKGTRVADRLFSSKLNRLLRLQLPKTFFSSTMSHRHPLLLLRHLKNRENHRTKRLHHKVRTTQRKSKTCSWAKKLGNGKRNSLLLTILKTILMPTPLMMKTRSSIKTRSQTAPISMETGIKEKIQIIIRCTISSNMRTAIIYKMT